MKSRFSSFLAALWIAVLSAFFVSAAPTSRQTHGESRTVLTVQSVRDVPLSSVMQQAIGNVPAPLKASIEQATQHVFVREVTYSQQTVLTPSTVRGPPSAGIANAQAIRFPSITNIAGLQTALNNRPSRWKTSIWDDFSGKANGALGTAASGQAWTNTGAGTLTVSSGKVVNNGSTSYMYADHATDTINRMAATWTFESGDTSAVVALISGPTNASMLGGAGYVHVICSRSSCSVQLYTGGSVVSLTNGTYTFTTPLPADSTTELHLSWELIGSTVYVALPDGNFFSVTDSRFSSLPSYGRRAIWEITSWNGTSTYAEPRFKNVAAYSKQSAEPFSPYMTREGVASMISASSSLKPKSMTFTPSTTGWHRVMIGTGSNMSGICMVSSMGQFVGSAVPENIFAYAVNPYQQGMIANLVPNSVNTPSVSQARVSTNGSSCYLDLNVTTANVPLTITLIGINTGQLQSVVASGVSAGGTASLVHSFSKAGIYYGTGSPESNLAAVVGSVYFRTDGGTSTTMYVKESGVGNTGWIAK